MLKLFFWCQRCWWNCNAGWSRCHHRPLIGSQLEAIPMTLSDLQAHSPNASHFKCDVSYSSWQDFSWQVCCAVPSAVAELLVIHCHFLQRFNATSVLLRNYPHQPSHSLCVVSMSVIHYVWLQQLESLTFIGDGKEFISCHANGSYIAWNTASSLRPKEQANTPYGKYCCLIHLHFFLPFAIDFSYLVALNLVIAAYCFTLSIVVCLCVCLCVCWSRSWALQKQLNRSRCC